MQERLSATLTFPSLPFLSLCLVEITTHNLLPLIAQCKDTYLCLQINPFMCSHPRLRILTIIPFSWISPEASLKWFKKPISLLPMPTHHPFKPDKSKHIGDEREKAGQPHRNKLWIFKGRKSIAESGNPRSTTIKQKEVIRAPAGLVLWHCLPL